MATIKKTITLTQEQNSWIQEQLQNGNYADESAYISDLLHKEEKKRAEFLKTKAAIEKGLASGISKRSVPEIMEAVEQEMRADGRL